jgi:hypothetical protein
VAVILGIAFDPFVQNLIHYYPALIVDPSGTAVVSSNAVLDALGPPLNGGKVGLNLFDRLSLTISQRNILSRPGNQSQHLQLNIRQSVVGMVNSQIHLQLGKLHLGSNRDHRNESELHEPHRPIANQD